MERGCLCEFAARIGRHHGSGGIAMAKGDKGGKYKSNRKKTKKDDLKRDRKHDSDGNEYQRNVPWKDADKAQIAKGRSNAPENLVDIADAELKALNENKGRGRRYEIAPIILAVIWSYYCSLTSHSFRSLQGWSEETLEERFGVRIPHYSTICKYASKLKTVVSPAAEFLKGKALTTAADSTGIGSRTTGLWRHFVWGSTRGWLKLHALVDVDTGIVIAYTVTDEKTSDQSQLLGLVDAAVKAGFTITKVLADGAYDTYDNWNGMDDREIEFIANIRDNARTAAKCPARTKHVKYIRKHGKKEWYEHVGYTIRWKVETAFSSLKKLFGESLRAKSTERLNNELDWRIGSYNSYKVRCHA